ncbi:MAG: hypothetical protein ACREP7_22210 [Lysobacter sp.]
MLNDYLNWFDAEPAGQLLPEDGSLHFQRWVSLGAMFPPKRAITSTCRSCGAVEMRQAYAYDDHALRCSQCDGRVELWPPIEAMQVRYEWLPSQLALKLGSVEPAILLSQRVWRLARMPIRGRPMSVYLMRCGWSGDVTQTAGVLDADATDRQIVLSTKEDIPVELVDARRLFIPLTRVAHLEPEGLVFGVTKLAQAIAAIDPLPVPQKPPKPRWFELSEDGSRLRLQGEELLLSRKQRAFVLAIAEAHDVGQLRPKQAWVLKRAGYSRRNTSLTQICRRKEFARFIDWRNGEVAIRHVPVALKRHNDGGAT